VLVDVLSVLLSDMRRAARARVMRAAGVPYSVLLNGGDFPAL